MISEVLAYAANRATNGAVENISRHAAWLAAGSVVLLFGLIFVVLAAFWTIEPIYGPVQTATLIATACLVVAMLCFVVPSALQFLQRQRFTGLLLHRRLHFVTRRPFQPSDLSQTTIAIALATSAKRRRSLSSRHVFTSLRMLATSGGNSLSYAEARIS